MARGSAVDRYIATIPAAARGRVRELRALIRDLVPEVTERVSYGIATFDVDGRYLVYVGGFGGHVSLYPITPAIRKELRRDIAAYEAGKGTLRFPLDKPLPKRLITRIVRIRLAERATAPTAKRAASRGAATRIAKRARGAARP
jgi:uncharacterized protein YdhG (YjbR/CyaY superfamily)